MQAGVTELRGARFFDLDGKDRGWAGCVTYRGRATSGLAVFDVLRPEPRLSDFLSRLDRAGLIVQGSVASYRFEWASGYGNDEGVLIRGQLASAGLAECVTGA